MAGDGPGFGGGGGSDFPLRGEAGLDYEERCSWPARQGHLRAAQDAGGTLLPALRGPPCGLLESSMGNTGGLLEKAVDRGLSPT